MQVDVSESDQHRKGISESGRTLRHGGATINEKDASEYDVSASDQQHTGISKSDHLT